MVIKMKKMTKKERYKFAQDRTDEFLHACDGMSIMDVVDILHYHYMECLNQICEFADMDFREALETSKVYIDGIIEDMNNQDKQYN